MQAVSSLNQSRSLIAPGSIEKIGEFERLALESLDTASKAELLRACAVAEKLGGSAWRIECKAHAKLLDCEHAKRGRGNKDVEGAGVKAAAEEVARLRKCHPRTILRDAQIYRDLLQQNGGSGNTELEDKTFYVIALSAHEPQKALRRMAKTKRKRPDFSTREARQLVEDLNAGRTGRQPRSLATIDQIKAHLDHVTRTINKEMVGKSPKEEFVKRYYGDWKEDIDWERERLRNEKKALKKQIVVAYRKRGAFTDLAIATELDRPLEEIRALTKEMIAEGVFIEYVPEGGGTEMQHGNSRRQLLRLKNQPLGSAYVAPRTRTHYQRPEIEDPDEEDGDDV